MLNSPVVIDSSVFSKLFLDESDSDLAVEFFTALVERGIKMVAPTLFLYEIFNVAHHYHLPPSEIFGLLEKYRLSNLTLINPSEKHLAKAGEICKVGHVKNGFPSFYDAIFHAIACLEKGILVTADKKYTEKTKSFKHICMLSEAYFNIRNV